MYNNMWKSLTLVLCLLSGGAGAQVRVQEYAVPSGHRVHDVWADANPGGPIWISAQRSGHLGILDPKSGKVEFVKLGAGSSPPGDDPHVYAVYVDETDKVWASEWSAQVMLRFDPATERFESFRSSSSRANVRQIHGRKGEVWTPESAADKIVVYRY